MEVKVVYTEQQAIEAITWFLEGDLSVIALDTETMGKKWYDLQKQHKHAVYEKKSQYNAMEKEIKKCANDALYPTKNWLATLQLATPETCLVFVLKHSTVFKKCRDVLEQLISLKPLWLIQNAKFDLKQVSHHLNINVANMGTSTLQTLQIGRAAPSSKVWDTMLTEVLINGNRNSDPASLKFLAKKYPMPGYEKGDSTITVSDWWTNPLTPEQINYCAMDVFLLHHIHGEQEKVVVNLQLDRVQALEHRLTPTLVNIEKVGIKYDKAALDDFITRANQKYAALEEIFRAEFGNINANSPEQMLSGILDKYGVTPMVSKWDPNTNTVIEIPSCDKFSLLECGLRGETGVDTYIALKELGKNISMANDWLNAEDDRFFTEYIQLKGAREDSSGGTRTGRMSSKPNLQNQSNFMKQFLVADDGWVIVSADYSSIEMRLMASYANETVLKEMFINNIDPHTEMAKWAFKLGEVDKKSRERRIAKECNFGFLFGMYGRKFCSRVLRATGGEIRLTHEEGKKFRQDFFTRYPCIEWWHRSQFAQACVDGYVTTRSGRRRYYNPQNRPANADSYGVVYHPMQNRWVQSHYASDWRWRNVAYNMPIQGSAGDGLKNGLVIIDTLWQDQTDRKLFATVHDSDDALCREDVVDEVAAQLEKGMIQGMEAYLKDVPVEVEITYGKSWANPPNENKSKFYRSDEDAHLWIQTDFQKPLPVKTSLAA